MLLNEEYCGIFGIALERSWCIQNIKKAAELSERLLNCVVFILNPPTIYPEKIKVHPEYKDTQIAHYEPPRLTANGLRENCDAFSQSRNALVTTGNSDSESKYITEIKTTHKFNPDKIQAILVPEPLYKLVKEIFSNNKNIKIISVPLTNHTLKKIPSMLDHLHSQKLIQDCTVSAPSFETALESWCQQQQYKPFSIHAVRLHTAFDFTARWIKNLDQQAVLIKATNGTVVTKNKNSDGWVVTHKSFTTLKPAFEKLVKDGHPLKATQMLSANSGKEKLAKQLIAAKKENIMAVIYTPLTTEQITMLEFYDASIIKINNYYLMAYHPSQRDHVSQIVDHWDLVNKSITNIQALVRGYVTRTFFVDYKQASAQLAAAKETLTKAQTQFNEAQVAFDNAEQKLFPAPSPYR